MLERGHLAQSGTSVLFLFFVFCQTKRECSQASTSCAQVNTMDFYAFPFAMRPSGANANAQLILPGENLKKKNS